MTENTTKPISTRVSIEDYFLIREEMNELGLTAISDWLSIQLKTARNSETKNINSGEDREGEVLQLKERIKHFEEFIKIDSEVRISIDVHEKLKEENSKLFQENSNLKFDVKDMIKGFELMDRKNASLNEIIKLNEEAPASAPALKNDDSKKLKETINKLRESNAAKSKENISLKNKQKNNKMHQEELNETIDKYLDQITNLKNQLRTKRG